MTKLPSRNLNKEIWLHTKLCQKAPLKFIQTLQVAIEIGKPLYGDVATIHFTGAMGMGAMMRGLLCVLSSL